MVAMTCAIPVQPFARLNCGSQVQQHRPQPPLEHRAASCAGDIPLAVSDQREHALDRVGVRRQEQAKRRHDTAVEAEDYQDCGDVSS